MAAPPSGPDWPPPSPAPVPARRTSRPHWPSLIVIPLVVLLGTAVSVIGLSRAEPRSAIEAYLPADGTATQFSVVDEERPDPAAGALDVEQAVLAPTEAVAGLATAVHQPLLHLTAEQRDRARWLSVMINFGGAEARPQTLSLALSGDTLHLVGNRSAAGFSVYRQPWEVLSPRLLAGATVPIDGTIGHDGSEERVTGTITAGPSRWVDGCTDSTAQWTVSGSPGPRHQTLVLCPAGGSAPPGLAGILSGPAEQSTGAVWAGAVPRTGDPAGALRPRLPAGAAPSTTTVTLVEQSGRYREFVGSPYHLGTLPDGTVVGFDLDGDVYGTVRVPGLAEADGMVAQAVRWRARPGGGIVQALTTGSITVVATNAKRLVGYGSGGERLWTLDLGEIAAGLDAGDRLLVRTVDGAVRLVEPSTGRVLWHRRITPEPLRGSVLVGELPVALTAAGELVGLDPADGSERWRTEGDQVAALGRIGDAQVLEIGRHRVLARSPVDGSEQWTAPSRGGYVGTWSTTGDRPVGIVGTSTEATAYDTEGRVLWTRPPVAVAAVSGDLVYLGSTSESELRQAGTGAVLRRWTHQVRTVPAAVIVEDGVIARWLEPRFGARLVVLR